MTKGVPICEFIDEVSQDPRRLDMRHATTNRIVLVIVVSVALGGFAQLLYGQERPAHFENDGALASRSERSIETANVSYNEREDPWTADELVEPDALAKALSGTTR